MTEPVEIVRRGYDRIAEEYLRSRRADDPDIRLVWDLSEQITPGGRVLDAGCGAGWPISALLAERFVVSGIDLSTGQLRLATANVPDAGFAAADLRALPFIDATFAAIVSTYALIHVPREDHATVLAEMRRILQPAALLLVTMGASDLQDDVDDDYLGTGVAMYWSHYGREANLRLVESAGLEIVREELIVENEGFGGGAHLFVLARRPEEDI